MSAVAKINRQLKVTPEVRAGILGLVRAGSPYQPIAQRFNISETAVYQAAKRAGLTRKNHVGKREPSRDGMPTCPLCGLLEPCYGPHSAVEYSGRTREPEGHEKGNHFA